MPSSAIYDPRLPGIPHLYTCIGMICTGSMREQHLELLASLGMASGIIQPPIYMSVPTNQCSGLNRVTWSGISCKASAGQGKLARLLKLPSEKTHAEKSTQAQPATNLGLAITGGYVGLTRTPGNDSFACCCDVGRFVCRTVGQLIKSYDAKLSLHVFAFPPWLYT